MAPTRNWLNPNALHTHPESRSADLQDTPDAVREDLISFFVQLAQSLGLPRSVGEIFGALYSQPEPMTLDEVADSLKMSRGSASQGLRALQQMGAAHMVYVANDRRTYYRPETDWKLLAHTYWRDSVVPRLVAAVSQLQAVISKLDAAPQLDEAANDAAERRDLIRGRVVETEALFGRILDTNTLPSRG